MRILVTGGRDFTDWVKLDKVLNDIWEHEAGRFVTIIHGGAPGADRLAREWAQILAEDHEGDELLFQADWQRYGKAAGVVRNQRMLDEGKPDLVVAFPGGRGTADMVQRARKAGVEVREIL
jgi:UDP-N-acetylmuramoylalanine-D-glutamate ligase